MKKHPSYPYQLVSRYKEMMASAQVTLDLSRKLATDPDILLPWLNLMNDIVQTRQISPALLFNLDETSLRIYHKQNNLVVHPRGDIPFPSLSKETKLPLSAILTISAAGEALPTILLLPYAKTPVEFVELQNRDIQCYPNRSAWQSISSFNDIMRVHILPSIESVRKAKMMTGRDALLILDGHSSRHNPDLWEECSRRNVHVLSLPSHTSHVLQPLDRTVLASLKQ